MRVFLVVVKTFSVDIKKCCIPFLKIVSKINSCLFSCINLKKEAKYRFVLSRLYIFSIITFALSGVHLSNFSIIFLAKPCLHID